MNNTLRFALLTLLTLSFAVVSSAQTTPQTHDEFVEAGRQAALRNDVKAANEWYSKALKVRPDNYDILFARAATFVVLQKYEPAIKDLTVILTKYPDNVKVLYHRATYYLGSRDYKKSIADAEAVLKLEPNHAGAFQARGGAYLGMRKYKEALDDLNSSIRLNPKDPVTYLYRSGVYEAQGMAAQSQADKLKAQQLQGM